MKQSVIKIVLLVIAIAAVIAGIWFGRERLTLESIKEAQQRLDQQYENYPVLLVGGYIVVYILMAALGVPGAALMTLLAGALFGLWIGTIAVSFASSFGALGAFVVSRYILRDWVESRFGGKIETINIGVRKEGAFYLFTLRLIPLFPFFVINTVMGLTRMKAWTFYWVSQIGMLAGTIVYVNAGAQFAQITSLKSILSPKVWGAFVLIGLFPLAAKKILGLFRSRQSGTLVHSEK